MSVTSPAPPPHTPAPPPTPPTPTCLCTWCAAEHGRAPPTHTHLSVYVVCSRAWESFPHGSLKKSVYSCLMYGLRWLLRRTARSSMAYTCRRRQGQPGPTQDTSALHSGELGRACVCACARLPVCACVCVCVCVNERGRGKGRGRGRQAKG